MCQLRAAQLAWTVSCDKYYCCLHLAAGCLNRYNTSTRHWGLICASPYEPSVWVCVIVCVKQPPHHDSVRYIYIYTHGQQLRSSTAWCYWEGKGPWWGAISLHWNNTQANYSLNLTTGYKSLITQSFQPEWQSSNKASSHTSRQLMNNNEEQDTIRVTES